jgi:ribosomal protein S18 acetylase RimI-like enzyme
MVLVHPDSRRRGVATALLEHTISYLRDRVRCIKLDATPDG